MQAVLGPASYLYFASLLVVANFMVISLVVILILSSFRLYDERARARAGPTSAPGSAYTQDANGVFTLNTGSAGDDETIDETEFDSDAEFESARRSVVRAAVGDLQRRVAYLSDRDAEEAYRECP